MIINCENALAFLYVDKCDVYRNVVTKGTITKATRELVGSEVPCQIDTNETVPTGNDALLIQSSYTVFFKPEADILKGDELHITTEYGDTYTLYAGAPRTYVGSHKEVLAGDKQYV